jgi:hypothetical protein
MISMLMITAISAGMRAAILTAAQAKTIGFARPHGDGEWLIQVEPDGTVRNGGYALYWHGETRKLAQLELWELGALLDAIAPQATEQPQTAQALSEELREEVCTAVETVLGDAYDCTRVWSAWGVGTMSQDDFSLVSSDAARVAEIADAAMTAMGSLPVLPTLMLLEQAAAIALEHNYTGGGIDAAAKIRELAVKQPT